MKYNNVKKLVRKYLDGSSTRAEKYVLEVLLSLLENSDKSIHPTLDDKTINSFQKRVILKVQKDQNKQRFPFSKLVGWSIAASILLISTVAFVSLTNQQHKEEEKFKWVKSKDKASSLLEIQQASKMLVEKTPIRQTKVVKLPDGSSIALNANSKVEILADYGKNGRKVKLVGEAFFDVKPNPDQPFYVYSDNLRITVLGTSFNIKAYHGQEEISIAVRTGKVRVDLENGMTDFLEKAEKLVFHKHHNKLEKRGETIDKIASWKDGQDLLEDCSFKMLSNTLYNNYGIYLHSDVESVKNNLFNITIRTNRNLEDTLNQICAMLGRKYRKEGEKIIIY